MTSEAEHRNAIRAAIDALNEVTAAAFDDGLNVELDLIPAYRPGRAQPHVAVALRFTQKRGIKQTVKELIRNQKPPERPDLSQG